MLFHDDVLKGIVALVAYQLLQAALRKLTKRLNPDFYADLQQDPARKLRPYFVFPLGILFTLISVPACAQAFAATSPSTDAFGTARSMSPSEKICLGSRAVAWVSELPMLRYSAEYVAHHVLSLSSLGTILFTNFPRRPLYLIYAGLITELFSDSVCMLRYHGRTAQNSRSFRFLVLANALCLIVLRIVPALGLALAVFTPPTTVQPAIYLASVVFYCGYLLTLAYKQLSSLGHVLLILDRPASLRIMAYDVPLYNMALGTAIVAAQISSACIFSATSRRSPFTDNETKSMAVTGLGASLAGLVGARLFNHVLDSAPGTQSCHNGQGRGDGQISRRAGQSPSLPSPPLNKPSVQSLPTSTCGASGISIQGGVLLTAIFMTFTNTITTTLDRPLLIASMALSLPLGEAIGRVGCYLGGCCGSRLAGGKELYPRLPLLSSTMNLLSFLLLTSFVFVEALPLREAGILAISSNAAIRLSIEPLRASSITREGTKLARTTTFAAVQLFLSTGLMFWQGISTSKGVPSAAGLAAFSAIATVFTARFGRRTWLYLAQTRSTWHKIPPTVVRPMSAVALFAAIIFTLAVKDRLGLPSGTPHPETHGANSSPTADETVLSSSVFISNLVISGSIPLLAGSKGISKCGSRQ